MSSDLAISAAGLGKAYLIYEKPEDRLKQMLFRWRRYYEEYWAFQNVDLAIKPGETVGIIGRNGSGKSTLLQVIAGTLQANAGSIQVKGRVAPLLELGAGFNPEFTGRENIRLVATILGLANHQVDERYQSIVEFAGIGDFIEQQVKTYSSGMFARLAFAVAAHVDADILIVDETLSVGDAAFNQKCMRFIHGFKEKGTLLFVSHDTSAVTALCDKAVWLDKGQVRAEGDTKDITFAYHAALREELDGDGFQISGRRQQARPVSRPDFRQQLIKDSDKRNLIEVFEFDPDAPAFGVRGGAIVNVRFVDPDGGECIVLEGGTTAILHVECRATKAMSRPIVGFFVKDRLGQELFGDNTYLSYAVEHFQLAEGEDFEARFRFQMPYLPDGEYSVTVALADGTQMDHVQHHWMDEALIFRCEGGHVRQGLLGIPMDEIVFLRR